MPPFEDEDEEFDPHSRARHGQDPDIDGDDWADGDGPDEADLAADDQETVRCDACGRYYLESASKCPHCGHYPEEASSSKPLWFVVTLVIALLLVLVYFVL